MVGFISVGDLKVILGDVSVWCATSTRLQFRKSEHQVFQADRYLKLEVGFNVVGRTGWEKVG